MRLLDRRKAHALVGEAREHEAAGRADLAIDRYREALALAPDRDEWWYNLGLLYKYRKEWDLSLECNERAVALNPTDEANNWNLAIAATALRDWPRARATWARLGIAVAGAAGPIHDDFGLYPVRLNPDEDGEVVWARRLCPVRARIENIPLPTSGYARGDVVLHDGAATGSRLDAAGRERGVFNVFGLFEALGPSTWEARLWVPDRAGIEALESLATARGVAVEDWTATVRTLCRACSEGRPHDHHDQELREGSWQPQRRVGLSGPMPAVEALIEAWAVVGREARGLELGLDREED